MSTITERLGNAGIPFEVMSHAKADTSMGEAIALHVPPDRVAKTLIMHTRGRFVPAVIPASRRLDLRLARKAIGDRHARLATEEELRSRFPAMELGAFPPLPSVYGTPAYVDPEVLEHDEVVFAAGDRTESVRMRTADAFPEQETIEVPLVRMTPDDGVDEGIWAEYPGL
jgi:Ala-tRNA(Pro) deacylase